LRKGELENQARKCGNYREKGHNQQSYRGQPIANVDSNSDSDSKERDEEALEGQLETELIEYDLQLARKEL
jgi:hypothetical protein